MEKWPVKEYPFLVKSKKQIKNVFGISNFDHAQQGFTAFISSIMIHQLSVSIHQYSNTKPVVILLDSPYLIQVKDIDGKNYLSGMVNTPCMIQGKGKHWDDLSSIYMIRSSYEIHGEFSNPSSGSSR